MNRVIEEAGFPTVIITNLIDIAKALGSNRMVHGIAIPNPLGNPELPFDKEFELRKKIVGTALTALETEITEAKIF